MDIKTFTISGSGGVNRGAYNLITSPGLNYFYQVNFWVQVLQGKTIGNNERE